MQDPFLYLDYNISHINIIMQYFFQIILIYFLEARIMALTAKQKMFVANYIVDLNATQAAVKSGYSVKTANEQASRLLANVNIQQAVQEQMKAREQRTLVTADYVINNLKTVAERCMQGEPVVDREGEPIGEWKFDSSGANKSLELLGKHLKLFTDKTEISGKDGEELTINVNITDANS